MKKCIISFLLSMCMACSLLPGKAWAAESDSVPNTIEDVTPVADNNDNTGTVPNGETETTEGKVWDVSRSKTATPLDSNDQSTVTLSLPSAEEKLASDVVFVLDSSDCVDNVMNQVSELVSKLNELPDKSKENIKVGVVVFKGSALSLFSDGLVSVQAATEKLMQMEKDVKAAAETKDKEAVVLNCLKANAGYDNFIYKGSNLHSGLLGAQALLEADSEAGVDASRKYVITITDGMTYYWNDKDGNTYAIYNDGYSNSANCLQNLFYQWQSTWNIGEGYTLPSDFNWDIYITGAKERIKSDNGTYDTNIRSLTRDLNSDYSAVRFLTDASTFTEHGYHYVAGYTDNSFGNHALGIERSVVECLDTYQEMFKAGYQCYTLNPNYDEGTFPGLFTSKLNGIAGKEYGDVTFDAIKEHILYAVGKGSTVEDIMGSDFDFVSGSLKLTIGNETLASKVDGDDENVVYFGDDADTLNESNYRFKVVYDTTDDKFTWTINENVSKFAPVKLSYNVKLVERNNTAGTYTVATNKSAVLKPKNSAGVLGQSLSFEVPTVTYTVSDSGSGGGSSSSSDTPSSTSTDTPAAEQAQTATQTVLGATRPAETVAAQPKETVTEETSAVLGATRDESTEGVVLGQSRGAGTGDESHMAAWGGAAAGALALLALYFGIKNRKNRRF